jgi:3-oxoacyl-[acyl-carrier protein] reductase
MDLGLTGKIALVTAASDGLGFACARSLAEAGCRLFICARGEKRLDEARTRLSAETGVEVHGVAADLSREDHVSRLLEEVSARADGLDVLVANTGHIAYGGLFDLADTDWQAAFDLLIMGAVRVARGCVPLMRARGGGDMVFIGSSVAREPSPHLLLSNVFRVGVVALSKSLATALAKENIRVNCVTPGYFNTGRVRRRIDEMVAEEPGLARDVAVQRISGPIPAGRIGEAEELAKLVAFLASRAAGYITGCAVQIDGGMGKGLF